MVRILLFAAAASSRDMPPNRASCIPLKGGGDPLVAGTVHLCRQLSGEEPSDRATRNPEVVALQLTGRDSAW
jgi:hypothetical protein